MWRLFYFCGGVGGLAHLPTKIKSTLQKAPFLINLLILVLGHTHKNKKAVNKTALVYMSQTTLGYRLNGNASAFGNGQRGVQGYQGYQGNVGATGTSGTDDNMALSHYNATSYTLVKGMNISSSVLSQTVFLPDSDNLDDGDMIYFICNSASHTAGTTVTWSLTNALDSVVFLNKSITLLTESNVGSSAFVFRGVGRIFYQLYKNVITP